MFMNPIVVFALLNLGLVLGCQQSFGFSCKDQNNKDVDWFIVYKMPSMNRQSINGESTGTGYYYMDSNTLQLNPSSVPINFTNQAVAYTLDQLYSSRFNDSVFHVMYNDQQPDQEILPKWENIREKRQSSIYAHAKGVSFFDRGSGVWLVHSVPMFPPRYAFSYPESGNIYGQSMLCRTFNYTQLPKIGKII